MTTVDDALDRLNDAFPVHDQQITERALRFFEALINNMQMSPAQPNFDQVVDEVRHAREELAAEWDRRRDARPA